MLLTVVAAPSASANTTYALTPETIVNMNDPNQYYTITGSITTDGSLGQLTVANILSMEIAATSTFYPNFTASYTASPASSDFIAMWNNPPLSATATQLLWDFTNPCNCSFGLHQSTGLYPADYGWVINTAGTGQPYQAISAHWANMLGDNTNGLNSAFVLAEVQTPEPATFGLMGLSLVGLGFRAKRRKKQG